MNLKTEVTKLIGEGNLRKAISLILERLPGDHDRHSEFILLSARLSSLERDMRMGILGAQDAGREQNRVSFALLELVKDLEE